MNAEKNSLNPEDELDLLPLDFPEDDEDADSVADEMGKEEDVQAASQEENGTDNPASDEENVTEHDSSGDTAETPEEKSESEGNTKNTDDSVSSDEPEDKDDKDDKDADEPVTSVSDEDTDNAGESDKNTSEPDDKKAAEAVIKLTPKPGRKKRKKKKTAESVEISITSTFAPGQILQEGRVRADLSIEQVAQETKIKRQYIVALEEGETDDLPPPVYVEAYVKKLCSLYKVDARQVLDMLAASGMALQSHKVPGEILHDIEKGKQINLKEEERVKRFFKTALLIIAVLVLTVFGIFKLVSKGPGEHGNNAAVAGGTPDAAQASAGNSVPLKRLSSGALEVFLAPPTFTMTKLEIPETK